MKVYYYHKTDLEMGNYNLFDRDSANTNPPLGAYVNLNDLKQLLIILKVNAVQIDKVLEELLTK